MAEETVRQYSETRQLVFHVGSVLDRTYQELRVDLTLIAGEITRIEALGYLQPPRRALLESCLAQVGYRVKLGRWEAVGVDSHGRAVEWACEVG